MTQVLTLPTARIEAGAGETILDAILRWGWTSTYRCRRGACGVCQVRIVQGRVHHGPHTVRALPPERARAGMALACRAVPVTDLTLEPADGHLRCVVPWLHALTNAQTNGAATR